MRRQPAGARRVAALARGAILASMLSLGCGATTSVRPLGAGNADVHVSLGGPLLKTSGSTFPTPILMAGGGFGVTDQVDVSGDVDVTAAVLGVAHVATGVAYHPLLWSSSTRAVPAITIAESFHLLTNLTDTRFAPQTTAVAAWRVGNGHLLYGGGDLGVVVGHPVHATRVLAGPLVGGEWKATDRFGIALECKWLAPYYDVAPLAPDWVSPGSRGYLSVLLGFRGYLDGTP